MKRTLLILIATASLAHATLIDLTPGGFDLRQPFPTPVFKFFGQYGFDLENLAGANIVNGQPVWSPFTMFGADKFTLTLNALGTGANLGWDLSNTDVHLRFVLVESAGLIAHLYGVPGGQAITGDGFGEIDGIILPTAYTFAGSPNGVPDDGWTIFLLALSILVLLNIWRAHRRYV